MELRCEMCFKVKSLGPAQPGMDSQVCKGCFYEIDRVVGFLEMMAARAEGKQWTLREPQLVNPPNPPDETPESTETPANGRKSTRVPVKT